MLCLHRVYIKSVGSRKSLSIILSLINAGLLRVLSRPGQVSAESGKDLRLFFLLFPLWQNTVYIKTYLFWITHFICDCVTQTKTFIVIC